MDFDAIVLAGGRGSRLGGVSKSDLRRDAVTLLELALRAATGARKVVVVGDVAAATGYTVARESPPHSGPVAAIAAGLGALAAGSRTHTLVLACDVPGSAAAVRALQERIEHADEPADGVIAVDGEARDQYLVAVYSTSALAARFSSIPTRDASMRQLVEGLALDRVLVPAGSTDDVDTWQDAANLGVTR
ncbi:MAG TPA: NTP transferase domain-containing protein [Pseudolysinimonas sp.]|nr:NTP transferase domain-containing protein [Pseudolysinimonas sp.]